MDADKSGLAVLSTFLRYFAAAMLALTASRDKNISGATVVGKWDPCRSRSNRHEPMDVAAFVADIAIGRLIGPVEIQERGCRGIELCAAMVECGCLTNNTTQWFAKYLDGFPCILPKQSHLIAPQS
ncbi:MAG TPA: hypothetical protein VFN13_12060 [Rudaea sp.]|nr:hypothetical protein [Rudaea sp.]